MGLVVDEERLVPVKGRRARRVDRRVLRRVDAWSVLRFSLLLYLCLFVVMLVAGIVLWMLASSTGAIDNLEAFIGDLLALEEFRFRPAVILRASALGGLILVVLGSGANVLMVVLYNLISDVVGGIRVSVAEESDEELPAGPVV